MNWRIDCRQSGYTLLEMLIVIAILGLMVTLIATRGPLGSKRLSEEAVAGELAGALRETRANAIASGRLARLWVDLRAHAYRIDDAPANPIPADFAIGLRTTAQTVANDQLASIDFSPDGSSTGGWIDLTRDGRTARVGVDWLSGRVSIGYAH